jgi:hypothetical protein
MPFNLLAFPIVLAAGVFAGLKLASGRRWTAVAIGLVGLVIGLAVDLIGRPPEAHIEGNMVKTSPLSGLTIKRRSSGTYRVQDESLKGPEPPASYASSAPQSR